MKFTMTSRFAVLAAAVVSAAAAATFAAPPPVPSTPAAIIDLISARPFKLDQPYTSDWSKERPEVSAGYVLVLSVNPDLVYPRQVAEPVLYVGHSTAERINVGHDSGRVIAIVPSALDEKGQLKLDFTKSPIFFGTPMLPEQVDAATIEREVDAALAKGIAPFSATRVNTALSRGGNLIQAADKQTVLSEAARLIKRYAPTEAELADSLVPQQPAVDPVK